MPLVPTVGLEPTLPFGKQILSLLRLPIPPRRLPPIDGLIVSRCSRAVRGSHLPIWYSLVKAVEPGMCWNWQTGMT
jgi:hypothetical protein